MTISPKLRAPKRRTSGWSYTNYAPVDSGPVYWWHWFPRIFSHTKTKPLSYCGRRQEHGIWEDAPPNLARICLECERAFAKVVTA